MSHHKITAKHLQRQAVIYIRQSTLKQVEQNQESGRRQYQLVDRAQALGWSAAQCVVIDDDQAHSGAFSADREGYQRLISMIALREVGAILGLEVARLARNNLDWYQMLELAAAFEVLIVDEDAVYDPRDFNDRLLLGLKGTMAEVELHQIRTRMVRGRLNKAKRGELALNLPIGLDWDPHTDKAGLAIDHSVRHTIEMVFRLFGQLRSIRGVLNYLRREGLELPHQHLDRKLGRQIGWRRPSYDALYGILTNPVYAGVYCYGKKEKQRNPLTQTVHVRKRPRHEWDVFLPEHHPGYITLAEFEENQQILENNRNLFPANQGAPRHGLALLQGLVFCQHCGSKMRVRYSRGQPYYTCDAAERRYGDPVCNRASAKRVDALVEELFLTLINAETLELSLAYDEKLDQEVASVERAWQEKLQRLEYETELARRRYEMVDPENRLVAQTLETAWNQRLVELEAARRAYTAQKPTTVELTSTLEQLQHVVTHLRDYWQGEQVSAQDKKELLRCLIEQLFLESQGKVIRTRVCWYGGAFSELDVPKYIFSSPQLYHRIRDLARTQTDHEIAATLNQEGVTTVKNKAWTARRVMDFRLSNAIASGFTTNEALRLTDAGYITSAEAATQLGVSQGTIQTWYRLEVLSGKHDGGQSPLWIEWTEDVVRRLDGSATPDPRMVSVRSLCRTQEKRPNEVLAWAQSNGHRIYRLRRGSAMRFFILPKNSSERLQ
ncbi:MAG: recombinase family protein [Chloroflexi bacterium]|nr:recombinase family protein [Chloroflexota bacterium]